MKLRPLILLTSDRGEEEEEEEERGVVGCSKFYRGEGGGDWRRVGRSGLENYSSWPITRPIQGGILNGSNKGVLCCSIKFNSGDRWRLMDVHERERERGSCVSRYLE